MHVNSAFWIAMVAALAAVAPTAGAQPASPSQSRETLAAPALGSPSPAAASRPALQLRLEPMEREPADGRAAPDDEALAQRRSAVEAAPDDRQARFELVRSLIAAGKLDEALAAAEDWRSRDAYNLVVVRLIGDILSELGRPREALRAYSAVVELLPEDTKAQRALASVLKQGGNVQAAYERLSAALALRPDDLRIGFELADVAQRLGRVDEARERFEAIAATESAAMALRYPARQRLAQIYTTMRLQALERGDAAAAADLDARIAALEIKGGVQNDVKIYLTWDTDRSDVDLWVTNPEGEKVFYEHKIDRFGGALYDDVTTGYGPESFTAPQVRPGAYTVQVNYYSSGASNFPEARGEVAIVLHEGTDREERHVLPYRLFQKGQTVTVARIHAR
jgi:tetratricopeptide (TPR) repeat protein